jgi:putative transcriptional regulator
MKGRINWALIRSQDQATIDRLASEEMQAIGLCWENIKFFRPYSSRPPNVKAIRRKLGLSQSEFAKRFRLSQRTIQQWEQGRSKPDQPARNFLRTIEFAPHTVARLLGSTVRREAPRKAS